MELIVFRIVFGGMIAPAIIYVFLMWRKFVWMDTRTHKLIV